MESNIKKVKLKYLIGMSNTKDDKTYKWDVLKESLKNINPVLYVVEVFHFQIVLEIFVKFPAFVTLQAPSIIGRCL
jgi:steroid 5-alpha reductase family enzyme